MARRSSSRSTRPASTSSIGTPERTCCRHRTATAAFASDAPAPKLRIRPARREDAHALATLLGQLGYPASAGDVARRLEGLQASAADRLVVADVDGDVVGLAGLHTSLSLEYDEPAAKLSALVVDERHRRQRIGEALVAAVEDEARRCGCCVLFLTTAERRHDAHAFYRRVGFEETGRRFAKLLPPAREPRDDRVADLPG